MTRWSRMFRQGIEQAEIARSTQVMALKLRCAFKIDGEFLRCTADAGLPHEHRHEADDLPGALADEERWKA